MSILVLDIGTTSMRGILYGTDGTVLAVHQTPNHVEFHEDGEVTESPEDWQKNTVEIVRSIVEQKGADGIECVSVTSQRSSIIPVDADGTPLMDTIMWQDTRNREICEALSADNALLFERTGSRANTVFSGSKMTWVRRNCPDLYRKVYKFVNIPEYIMFLMTGEFHSDYTYASRSGLMNLKTRRWDDDMLRLYDVDPAKLCPLHEPGCVVAKTTSAFEKMTGLRTGTPVISAGGDQQCAAIGQGVTSEGSVSIVAGTGGFIIEAVDEVPEHLRDNVICNASSIAGKYVIEANVLACSAAFDWFCHELYGMDPIDYTFTEKELEKENNVTDCLVIPYFKGRGAPDWNAGAKAAFLDVTLATKRSALLKSMMESIFMELANHLASFGEYAEVRSISVSGGMTKSRALNQLQADVYGRKIRNLPDKEATAKGAFLVALVTLGDAKNVEEAYRRLYGKEECTVYLPDERKHRAYEQKRARMNKVYEKLKYL